MDINYFDLIAGSLILLLGLKGILNGFFKELFGLIGIVGGVFLASRLATPVGEYLSSLIFKFENEAAIKFTGFLVTLALFWAAMIALGITFKKLSKLSGLGVVDRVLGFIFGAGKFFFIFSIIAYALYNVKVIRTNLEKPMQNSILFPIMIESGKYIMKLDPVDTIETIKQKEDEIQEKLADTLQSEAAQKLKEQIKQKSEDVKKELSELKDK